MSETRALAPDRVFLGADLEKAMQQKQQKEKIFQLKCEVWRRVILTDRRFSCREREREECWKSGRYGRVRERDWNQEKSRGKMGKVRTWVFFDPSLIHIIGFGFGFRFGFWFGFEFGVSRLCLGARMMSRVANGRPGLNSF